MNSKRRAELQRNLSMGAVPRPPAGLAERIKADIPKYLKPEAEQRRISTSIAFTMRIAASLLLLITSVLVTLHVMQPNEEAVTRSRIAPIALEKAVLQEMPGTATTQTASAAVEEVRVEISEDLALPPQLMADAQTRGRADAPAEPAANAIREEATTDVATARLDSFAFSDEGKREAAPAPTRIVDAIETESAPASARAPAPAPATGAAPQRAAVATPPTPAAVAEGFAVDGVDLVTPAYAAELDLGAKKSVFGISVDPDNFHRIKESLEGGERPERSDVNIEALVNYFAGAPARPPKRGVHLEVEASPAPIEAEGDHAILRFTIDTPAVELPQGGSIPPAVKDVRIEIDIDRTAVASYRRVGEGHSISSEPLLLNNMSVTGLYELELRPRLKASQRVATVRLHYRSITDNRARTIERVVRGRDLAKDWARASRRHRLASLGAVWGESLKDSAQRNDVAKRAEELATQNPRDPLARELAEAASATGGER